MSSKLKDTLYELPTLTKEELVYRRHFQSIERAKIESKLMELEDKERQGAAIDVDLYRRTEFALKAAGIIMAAIDSELGIRKTKSRMTFHEAFYKTILENVRYGDIHTANIESMVKEARSMIGETSEG